MEEDKDVLDMRNLALYSQNIGALHVHHNGSQVFSPFACHAREEPPKGSGFSVFAHPDHSPGLVVQDHCQVAVSFADGDLVYGQDAKILIIGLSIVPHQKLLVHSPDCFPVKVQMKRHLLDSHEFAKLVNVMQQSLGHPQIRIEKMRLFDGNLLTVGIQDLPVMAEDP